MCMNAVCDPEDDVETIVVSNVSPPKVISPPDTIKFANAAMPATPQVAIADSGAAQIFIMRARPSTINAPPIAPSRFPLLAGDK